MERMSLNVLITGLFCTVFVSLPCVCDARASTQKDVDLVANQLVIGVSLSANYDPTSTFVTTISLYNPTNVPLLTTADWEILFTYDCADRMMTENVTTGGLILKPWKECIYSISRHSSGYRGQMPKADPAVIVMRTRGISAFKNKIHPRFIIKANDKTIPKTILSTDNDERSFVKLSKDPSDPGIGRQTVIEKAIHISSVNDFARVPSDLTVPTPVVARVNYNIIFDLNGLPIHINASKLPQSLKNYFFEQLIRIKDIKKSQVIWDATDHNGHVFTLIIDSNIAVNKGFYRIYMNLGQNYNETVIEAASGDGLMYATATYFGVLGGQLSKPQFMIEDWPDSEFRAINMDFTKHFLGFKSAVKLLDVMNTYKFNTIVANLADDFGWRLDFPDLPELTKYGARRCLSDEACLPPYLGAGATGTNATNGYFSEQEFFQLLKIAEFYRINVIPQFNLIGGLFPAKRATHQRYLKLYQTNPTEANKLHLQQKVPKLSKDKLKNKWSFDGLMDHCDDATMSFMKYIIKRVAQIYDNAGVQLKGFHIGGDELTQYIGKFSSCKTKGLNTAAVLRNVLAEIRSFLPPQTKLHVNEQAVIDPSTNMCLNEIASSPSFKISDLVVHFSSLHVENLEYLDQEQLRYMNSTLPDPTDPNAMPDPLKEYLGKKQGVKPWGRAYICANAGYKIVMEPEQYYGLHAPAAPGFDEPGFQRPNSLNIINYRKIMAFEKFNMYANLDHTTDGVPILPHRLCKVHDCQSLKVKENVIGASAIISTENIRSEHMLMYMMLPRIMAIAESMWREAPYKNIVKAEVIETLMRPDLEMAKMEMFEQASTIVANLIAHKELMRMEERNFAFKMPEYGLYIHMGLAAGLFPGYPLVVKAEMPIPNMEYRERNGNGTWQRLFSYNEKDGSLLGGYMFPFPPDKSLALDIRARSPGGTQVGEIWTINGGIEYFLPKAFPVALRRGACLSIVNPGETDLTAVTEKQWKKVLENMVYMREDQTQFEKNRIDALQAVVNEFNRRSTDRRSRWTLNDAFNLIQRNLAQGVSYRNVSNEYIDKQIFVKERNIFEQRNQTIADRYRLWETQYQQCKTNRFTVKLDNFEIPQGAKTGPVQHKPISRPFGGPGHGQPGDGGPLRDRGGPSPGGGGPSPGRGGSTPSGGGPLHDRGGPSSGRGGPLHGRGSPSDSDVGRFGQGINRSPGNGVPGNWGSPGTPQHHQNSQRGNNGRRF